MFNKSKYKSFSFAASRGGFCETIIPPLINWVWLFRFFFSLIELLVYADVKFRPLEVVKFGSLLERFIVR